MDDQKKQKILIAVLAVAALGAGSYYFVFRDSGVDPNRGKKSGPVVKRERASTQKAERPTKRRVRARDNRPKQQVTIRERKKSDRKGPVTKRKRDRKKAKPTKKKLQPAA